ncbi:glycogen/starch/alpha-glucan phosphorylase [Desulfosediminicola sp.]|uniref:glycogen/starch/alpha-glucan phosphorylase n=1 Tax=Desulfosediminicola sp. TaxID=2886825 RepID=UPI003AF24BA9
MQTTRKQPLPAGKKSATDVAAFREKILHYLKFTCGKSQQEASSKDITHALSLAIREDLINGMIDTSDRYHQKKAKRLYYLSMEFLVGRSLGNNLFNLEVFDLAENALRQIGVDLEEIREHETDAALGNGGLGRLAACFLDSLATMDMPGYGYGLNYEFGLFRQEIANGYQREKPGRWDGENSPWLITRSSEFCMIPVYGKIDHSLHTGEDYNPVWLDWQLIVGVPHDMPIVGYGGKTINYLRLFSARASDEFDIQIFNDGDYFQAVSQKISSETVSKVLYPSDSVIQGKESRLVQEFFLVACSVQDIIRKFQKDHRDFTKLPEKVALHMNDTHPALAVAELMRVLIDEHSLEWETAWDITRKTCAYTNHTLLPEALEKWPVSLFERVLPRHLQIIYEINHRFLEEVKVNFPHDENIPTRMSLIEEQSGKQVNMAHLAIVGSHSINGVAALHSNLVRSSLFPDFATMWPDRFNNKTNGVTQRRWLLKANPALSKLITETIGDEWITNLKVLKRLADFATDPKFQKKFMEVKSENKKQLAKLIQDKARVKVKPESLFDIQIKRIHEYKRQLLNVLCIIHSYLNIIEDKAPLEVPRTHIFAGKAAPGYAMAKLIIKLINSVGQVVNNDKRAQKYLKVVMLPDYCVSLAEKIIPAADLSEQISIAGMEASGTGNMKLTLNGALTIGTLDGANIEIMEEVGRDNIFIFGLEVEDIEKMRSENSYNPWDYYANNPNIRRVMDALSSDMFSQERPGLFNDIYNSIMYGGDFYCHLADLQSYIFTQQQVSELYAKPQQWAEKAILNVARVGKFSSDRTIEEYAREIWNLKSVTK